MSPAFLVHLLDLSWDLTWWTVVWWGGAIVGLMHVPSVLLRRETRPMAALAWILGLISLPILGVVLWWLMGRTHLERRRRSWARSKEAMDESLAHVRESMELSGRAGEHAQDGGARAATDRTLYLREDEGIFPTTEGNRIEVFSSGREAFDAFEDAIRGATDHIHFQFYIWRRDEVGRRFRDLLADKAREGVEVRVLYDAVGGAPVKHGFMDPLIEAGAKVESFLDLVFFESQLRINFRNHRKIIVIDGEVGFTGGVNIGEEYNDWLDLAFRLDGPVVWQLQEVFAEDWYFASGEDLASRRYFKPFDAVCTVADEETDEAEQAREEVVVAPVDEEVSARIIASGPDNRQSAIANLFFLAITRAEERILITTPYFVPDQALLMAIKTAVIRGVDVRLLTPGKSDIPIAQAAGRSYYAELLEAGVHIYEYEDRVLHAKAIVIDEQWSIIGSANMDIRSFLLNFEANAVLKSRTINAYLAKLFERHLERSTEMSLQAYQTRRLDKRLIESTARLFSPLL
jgi:cardiolipin synthase A/B